MAVKLTLADITATYAATTQINQNFTDIEDAFDNTLSRDGTAPNSMSAQLDMNSNRIINLPAAVADNDPVTLQQLNNAANATLTNVDASNVNITDTGAYYDSTTVEGALAEVVTDMGSTANGLGASRVGVEDAAANFVATDVEAALAELAAAQQTATTTTEGVVELATAAEIDAGTAGTLAITAANLNATSNFSYESGTFTIDWLGFTTTPQSTVDYTRLGNLVMMEWPVLSAVSNTNALISSGTPLPASLRPLDTKKSVAQIVDNGNVEMGHIWFYSTGAIGATRNAGSFTASGTKGIGGGQVYSFFLD